MGKTQTKAFVNWVSEVAFGLYRDVPSWHSSERCVGPKGLFACGFAKISNFL